MGVLPQAVLAESTAPFAAAATEMWGAWAGDLVAVGAIVTTTTLIAYLYGAAAELTLVVTDRAAFSATRLGRDAVIGSLGLAYSIWTIVGAGYAGAAWTFFLLIAGIPVYLLMTARRAQPPPAVHAEEPAARTPLPTG